MQSMDIGTEASHRKQVDSLIASVSSLSESVARCAAVQQVMTPRLRQIEDTLTERTVVPSWQPLNHEQNAQFIEINHRLAKLENVCVSLHRHDTSEDAQDVSLLAKQLQADLADVKEQRHSLSQLAQDLGDLRKDVAELKQQRNSEEQQHQTKERVTSRDDKLPSSDLSSSPNSHEMVVVAHEKVYLREAEYELQESIWHFALFIGLPETGSLGSIWLTMLLVVNSSLQIALCFIINDIFTAPQMVKDDIADFRKWRVQYGHSTRLMNDFTQQPFVKGICDRDSALFISSPAELTLGSILEYSPSNFDEDSFIGPLMPTFMPDMKYIGMTLSLMAIFIWSMNVVRSLLDIRYSAAAFFGIPRAHTTVLAHESDSCRFVSVSTGRQVLYGLVLMLQLFVVVILGITGVFYIIYTIGLRDLLLNCSALALVLDIDEEMAVFVPSQAHQLLVSLVPLTRPASKGFKGLNKAALAKVVIVLVIMSVSFHELLVQVQLLNDVREEICGGNTNFVAGVDKAGVVTATTPPRVIDWGITYYEDAILQLIHDPDKVDGILGGDDMSAPASSITGGIWSLMGWLNAGHNDVLDYWNDKCVDMVGLKDSDPSQIHFLRILREAVQNRSINDCSDIVQHCFMDDAAGVQTRFVCPITCGCNDLGSPLILMDGKPGDSGCPTNCYTTSTYKETMRARECKDLGLASSYWSNYTHGLQYFLEQWTDGTEDEVMHAIKDNGCGTSSMELKLWGMIWPDPCETWRAVRWKSIIFACPVSCGCASNFRPGCPERCRLPQS